MASQVGGTTKLEKLPENAVAKDSKPSSSPAFITGDVKRKLAGGSQGRAMLMGTKGRGDSDANKKPSDRWIASQEEQEEYDFVRMLYRSQDHGVTAISETAEERQSRAKQCKTTG
jgi:hypothetical protein